MRHKESKTLRSQRAALQRHKAAAAEPMPGEPPVNTWSARMPAYCYTALCPVAELRGGREQHGDC